MEESKAELLNGIREIISMLNEKKSCNDLELCTMRLEALAASALGNDAIPYLVIKSTVFLEKNDNLDPISKFRTNFIFIIIRMYCKFYIQNYAGLYMRGLTIYDCL